MKLGAIAFAVLAAVCTVFLSTAVATSETTAVATSETTTVATSETTAVATSETTTVATTETTAEAARAFLDAAHDAQAVFTSYNADIADCDATLDAAYDDYAAALGAVRIALTDDCSATLTAYYKNVRATNATANAAADAVRDAYYDALAALNKARVAARDVRDYEVTHANFDTPTHDAILEKFEVAQAAWDTAIADYETARATLKALSE